MKLSFIACFALIWANVAVAHVGHLAEVAGHGHWLGAAALGAAIALGAWAGLKGKHTESHDAEDAECDEEELQEA